LALEGKIPNKRTPSPATFLCLFPNVSFAWHSLSGCQEKVSWLTSYRFFRLAFSLRPPRKKHPALCSSTKSMPLEATASIGRTTHARR